MQIAKEELEVIYQNALQSVGQEEAEIFRAQSLMVDDPPAVTPTPTWKVFDTFEDGVSIALPPEWETLDTSLADINEALKAFSEKNPDLMSRSGASIESLIETGLLRDAGLPKNRFYDLRHTSASLMLNHGVPLVVVSRRPGHAKPSITLDTYGHLIPGMQVEVAEIIDELVTPVKLHQLHPKRTPESKQNRNTPICSPN